VDSVISRIASASDIALRAAFAVASANVEQAMNFKRNRIDDTMGFAAIVVFALLAVGLQVSVSMGYVLDRDGIQAHADEQARSVQVAAAASAAAKAREVRVAMRRP
jgi:hypothetical protein